MTKQPTDDQLRAAIGWLEAYEGAEDDPTPDALDAVSSWLVRELEARKLRRIAKDNNMPVSELRKRLRAA